ncbi:MAG: winged helix-turn-helix domain-containing protein [Candidatus Aenigmatarchaeota archaeon]
MPQLFDEILNKALSSDVRREILLSLEKKDKYLTEIAQEIKKKPQTIGFHLNLLEEIGLVKGEWREGKKYYSLKEKKILDFLKKRRVIPEEFRPKPPHEIVLDMWDDMKKRLDRIEKRLDSIEKKRK